MFSKYHSVASRRHTLVLMCVFLGLSQSGLAGPPDALGFSSNTDDKFLQPDDEARDARLRNLNGVSIEDRMRLRMDLNNYSRASDPIHSQIQDRRRAMSKAIQERFLTADKDNDGLLSRQEVVDNLPQVARHYNQVDVDGDNFISVNELVAYQAMLIERQRAAELRIQQAREAELKELENAQEEEIESKQTKRPKVKSKQAEAERRSAL